MHDHAILEIGIDQKNSLAMWLEYLPHAFIYGVDIGVEKVARGDRFEVFQADQSDRSQLKKVVDAINRQGKPVFAVLDDGYFQGWSSDIELGREGFKTLMRVELRRQVCQSLIFYSIDSSIQFFRPQFRFQEVRAGILNESIYLA